jgi:pimeloyl-ACP methyl ester carboxylesterase
VLANALHKSWTPNPRQQQFLSAPRLMSPLFVVTAPGRMRAEMRAAFPRVGERLRFMTKYGACVAFALASPAKMARRVTWANAHRFADVHGVTAPALLVTGEPDLDKVVPVDVTRRYLEELAGAQHVVLERTGHNGLVTRPDDFANLLGRFVDGIRLSA